MTIPSQDLMLCARCGELKHQSEMNKRFREGKSGASHVCKECDNAYAREYRKKNAEKHKAYYTKWRARNKDKLRKQAQARRSKLSDPELAKLRRREADRKNRLMAELKDSVYQAYGGYLCSCCGEKEPTFLSIDHVNNDGNEQREKIGQSPQRLYAWLRRNGYPDGYQVLCMNCNVGKHRNGGVCPHQVRCNDYPEGE